MYVIIFKNHFQPLIWAEFSWDQRVFEISGCLPSALPPLVMTTRGVLHQNSDFKLLFSRRGVK